MYNSIKKCLWSEQLLLEMLLTKCTTVSRNVVNDLNNKIKKCCWWREQLLLEMLLIKWTPVSRNFVNDVNFIYEHIIVSHNVLYQCTVSMLIFWIQNPLSRFTRLLLLDLDTSFIIEEYLSRRKNEPTNRERQTDKWTARQILHLLFS